MAQVFSKRFTFLLRTGALAFVAATVLIIVVYRVNARADAPEQAPIQQPIPFSHQHHARDDGIDCRYCHTSVETSAFAGIPPLATCMTCHSELFATAGGLHRCATRTRATVLEWNRVHDLPDFVYFDHSIHVAKGVGCSTCHGAVDRMPLTRRVASLYMQWCLECHRQPEPYLRERDQVFDMSWSPPPDQQVRGEACADTACAPRAS